MRGKLGVLIVSLVFSLIVFSGYALSQEATVIEGYSEVNRLLGSDCFALKEALLAKSAATSYIPNVGWLFVVENAGKFNFERMATAVQGNLISLDLLIARKQIMGSAKIIVSFKVQFGDDYILVFHAKDLNDVNKWKVYKGSQ